MNIWFDITHTPPINAAKVLIKRLASEGNTIYITVLNRGRLVQIVNKELEGLDNIHISVVGNHRMNKWSVLFEANLLRMISMYFWALRKNLEVSYSGSVPCALVSRMVGCYPITLVDDPQAITYHTIAKLGKKTFCTLYEKPDNMVLHPKSVIIKSLKEWAYLSPSTFIPSMKILEDYQLKPHTYMFLREVSVGTSNYMAQAPDSILKIAHLIPQDIPVVLSLEKKDKFKEYPQHWILLQEPVSDIHSLIYYSFGLISSGDSMAREAALMGVPAYYLGVRYSMPSNAVAARIGSLNNQQTCSFEQWIQKTVKEKAAKESNQESLRHKINCDFVDVNQFLHDEIINYNGV